jgi:hypothetical protein
LLKQIRSSLTRSKLLREAAWRPNHVWFGVLSSTKEKTPSWGLFFGGQGGTRTLKPYRQRILSPQRIPIPPLARKFGGANEIRTRVQGFADPCLTPRPSRHLINFNREIQNFDYQYN